MKSLSVYKNRFYDESIPYLTTGIFPLDLGLGGGFMQGRIHLVYGTPFSGKSSIVHKFIKSHPGNSVYFVDFEGCHLHDLIKTKHANILYSRDNDPIRTLLCIKELLYHKSIDTIIIDSIAVIDDSMYGSFTESVCVFLKNLIFLLDEASVQNGYKPTVIILNQTRDGIFKRGTSLPGGEISSILSCSETRFFRKSTDKDKRNDAFSTIGFQVEKSMGGLHPFTADVRISNSLYLGRERGDISDEPFILNTAYKLGILLREKNGWSIDNEWYRDEDIMATLIEDRWLRAWISDRIWYQLYGHNRQRNE